MQFSSISLMKTSPEYIHTEVHGVICTFVAKSNSLQWIIKTIKKIMCITGPDHMRTNDVPKDVSERDSALSWFESLILALVNAKLFQIRLLKREKRRAFWIVIRVESLILGHLNAKLFRNVIRACAFWKCTLKPCMGQSARTAQWEQNITSQYADPDRDWEGVCNACERT